MSTDTSKPIADAPPENWVDSHAPAFAKPYLKLARADRPIGTWLLLFPCWWSQFMGHLALGQTWINLWFLVLFAIGAFVMRGAGCTWNDIVDRDYDGRVARTALRPIPSGQVTARQALYFAIALSLIGFVVLIQFNWATIVTGILSLALVAAYPFAKRHTYFPQIVLGLTFNWGALVGWMAVTGAIGWPALLLYLGGVFWTVGYDTIYAHQDADDDALIGLKSTALKFGRRSGPIVACLYTIAVILWLSTGWLAGATGPFFVALAAIAAHFGWQAATLETTDGPNCLARFKSNQQVGWMMSAGLALEIALITM